METSNYYPRRVEIPAVALIGKGKGIAMTYKWIDGDPLGGAVCRLEAGREKRRKAGEDEGGKEEKVKKKKNRTHAYHYTHVTRALTNRKK